MSERQEVRWKDDYDIKCPFCKGTYNYTIYLNTEQIDCHGCEMIVDIAFMAEKLEAVAT